MLQAGTQECPFSLQKVDGQADIFMRSESLGRAANVGSEFSGHTSLALTALWSWQMSFPPLQNRDIVL
jgi:hypothetical protein